MSSNWADWKLQLRLMEYEPKFLVCDSSEIAQLDKTNYDYLGGKG